MKLLLTVGLLCGVWAAGLVQAVHGRQGTSTWSGVYTEEQAKRGQAVYTKACAECHGQDLAGDGFAPSLKGPDFMNNWNGLSVADLLDRIRVSMPPENPGAVSIKEKADIIAFMLKESGFPAGTTELPAAADALKPIKFEATKPGR